MVTPQTSSPPLRSLHTRALLGLVLATLFWGLTFPLVKALILLHGRLLPGSSTWFITTMVLTPRYVLATVFLAGWLLLSGRGVGCTRAEMVQGTVIGLFASVGMILQSDALQFTAASTSAFLTQLYAILIPLYLAWRTRRNPGGRVWISGMLVVIGVAVLANVSWRELKLGRGEWETLLCSVFFMGQILWLEKKEYVANRPERISLVMFATQAIVLIGMLGFTAPHVAAVVALFGSTPWLIWTVMLTVVCTLGAYMLMNFWQPKISAIEAGLIYCVEPIFGSTMALFLPAIFSVWGAIEYANETATWTLLVGGGLITAANVLIQIRPPKKSGL